MKKTVSVIGEGMLAAIVSKTLSDRFEVVGQSDLTSDVPETAELIIVVYDDECSSDYIDAGEVLGWTLVPWLRGFTCRDEGYVGPSVRPGIPGCSLCADNRRLLTGHRPEEECSRMPARGSRTCTTIRPWYGICRTMPCCTVYRKRRNDFGFCWMRIARCSLFMRRLEGSRQPLMPT